jgi:flavin reductase (DIM6/NTAB) family NADH-FMN oxidoreductase RutF
MRVGRPAPTNDPGTPAEREASPAPELLRRAFGAYATGIAVIGARSADGMLVGMTANSFTSVSLNPPLVLFCPARSLSSFHTYNTATHFSASILPAGAESASNHFAKAASGKWNTVPHSLSELGLPFLDFAIASFDCEVMARHEAGDHVIVIGRVLRARLSQTDEPLVFFRSRYRQLDARTQAVEPEGEPPFSVWG